MEGSCFFLSHPTPSEAAKPPKPIPKADQGRAGQGRPGQGRAGQGGGGGGAGAGAGAGGGGGARQGQRCRTKKTHSRGRGRGKGQGQGQGQGQGSVLPLSFVLAHVCMHILCHFGHTTAAAAATKDYTCTPTSQASASRSENFVMQ